MNLVPPKIGLIPLRILFYMSVEFQIFCSSSVHARRMGTSSSLFLNRKRVTNMRQENVRLEARIDRLSKEANRLKTEIRNMVIQQEMPGKLRQVDMENESGNLMNEQFTVNLILHYICNCITYIYLFIYLSIYLSIYIYIYKRG